MSIASKLSDLSDYKTAIASEIISKGGTVSQNAGFGTFATDIATIPTGASEAATISKFLRKEIPVFTADYFQGVTSLPAFFFQGNRTITSITLSDTVETIEHHNFNECWSLTSIVIGNGLKTVQYSSFCFMNIASLTFPATLTSIGAGCFSSISVTSITFLSTTPPTLSSSFGGNYPIYVPAASVSAYQSATKWSDYASRIQAIPA